MPPANDSREEIPWNLFETGDMKFPTVPGVVGVSFASSVPKSTAVPSDYQQRMVASILQKVFYSERRTRGFVSPRIRTKNRLAMVLFALIAIAGVLLILSGVSGGKIERSEEHTSELQSRINLVCRLLLEKKKQY